ncbi:FAD-dependent oxidoreductase [Campylobacter geochelonis]|uniref:FAD-dependent oxidoreductase n=1 Tax=Campylobacter geochelonis TaxID=1780362 RepID=UPI000770ACF3|nr:FAD-dependent oxidoreductase [Campylobacter geochelonis]CZE50788.1 pyridine nucleotide-disulfide oxidoreductase YkgC [Campylobacter geochelonis]
MKNYDLVVIGFGKAGKTLASKFGALGKKVAVIEKSPQMYGGTCINIGCIPTKKMVEQSKFAKFHSDKMAYYAESVANKNALIKALRAKNYAMLDDNANIDVIDGVGSFLSEKEVKITKNDGTTQVVCAPNIIINTGSIEQKPDCLISSNLVYSSTQILELTTLPKHLVVLGMGYIALEFASLFANFGSKVTIVARKSDFMPKEDEDVAASVLSSLQKQGIEVILSANLKEIVGEKLTFESAGKLHTVEADAFLAATGRVANTADLALQNAGVKTDKRGNIITNEFLQTTAAHIYAVGDVKGGKLFTYISLDDYRIVFSHLCGDSSRTINNRATHASSLFLNTPLSSVGLKEKEAAAKGYEIKVAKLALSGVPRAKILSHDDGFLKAIIDAKSGKILGAAFHSVDSSEIINQIAIAMELGATYKVFQNQIFTHPSISEALNDLFGQFA